MTISQRIESQACGCDAAEHDQFLISVDEALRRIDQHTAPVEGTDTIPLVQAAGRILAEPVRARAMTPPFDNAAMDGYAVATSTLEGDGPWTLSVTGRVAAGQVSDLAATQGHALRILTGAVLPRGADAVVMQEDVHRVRDGIRILRRPAAGLNIRLAGADMRSGQIVLEAGRRLGAPEVAACAAAGHGFVRVRRPVRAALLVTGDEIREAGSELAMASIWDVITPMMCSVLTGPDVELVSAERNADDIDGLRDQLAEMAGSADLIVTSGGLSVGDADHVKPALRALGADIHFSGIAVKPGKPVSFGRVGAAHWLGLPGNPLSAFVTWQVFGNELLNRLAGATGAGRLRRHVVIDRDISRKPGRCEFRPARVAGFDPHGREVVTFAEATHSERVAGLSEADGLILLPAEADRLTRGMLVEFQPFV